MALKHMEGLSSKDHAALSEVKLEQKKYTSQTLMPGNNAES